MFKVPDDNPDTDGENRRGSSTELNAGTRATGVKENAEEDILMLSIVSAELPLFVRIKEEREEELTAVVSNLIVIGKQSENLVTGNDVFEVNEYILSINSG